MPVERRASLEPVCDILIAEHRAMAALLDQAMATPVSRPEERTAIFAGLARLLRAHAHAEEKVFFPALDGLLEVPFEIRDESPAHVEIEAVLRAIEQTPATAPEWRSRVATLRGKLAAHADEEQVVFLRARSVILDVQAIELGLEYARVRDEQLARLGG